MNKEREFLARTILKEIEYGRLPAAETERRLNRIIDRELSGPIDRPVNTELISLCSGLIMKLHGAAPIEYDIDALLAAARRSEPQKAKSVPRRSWRFVIAAAAALIVVILGGLGIFRTQWFARYSSEDQEQFIIEGREFGKGNSAGADIDVYASKDKSIRTQSIEELINFLGFDPHFPEEICQGYPANDYFGNIGGSQIMAHCYYLTDAIELPEGETVLNSNHIHESIYYNIVWDPDISRDEYCSSGFSEEGFDKTIEGVRVRCSMVDPNYFCSWRSGNAITTLVAHKPEIDLFAIAASLIRAQAEVPLTNEEIDRIVDETTRREHDREITIQKGSTGYSGTSLKELIRFTGYDPYLPETLCGLYTPQVYTAVYPRKRLTVTCDFYSGADATGDKVSYTRMSLPNNDARITDFIPAEALDQASQMTVRGTPVTRYEADGMTVWLWGGYAILYRLEAPAVLELPDTAVDEILAANADRGRTKVLREAAEKAAQAEATVQDEARQEESDHSDDTAPDAYEPRVISADMIQKTLDMHAKEGYYLAESLDELGGYLGYSVSQWDLSPLGWIPQDISVTLFDSRLDVLMHLINEEYPDDQIRFSVHQFTEMEGSGILIEQNEAGTYDKIRNILIYKTKNNEQNIYTWTQGQVVYLLRSKLPQEVLDAVTAHLLGARPETEEIPPEDEVFSVDGETLKKAMAEREAAGLPPGRSMTREMMIAAIERHAGPPIEQLAAGNLEELEEYLGVTLDHLSLENTGWLIQSTEAYAIDIAIYSFVNYFKASNPQVSVSLSITSFPDISEAWFNVEQDKEGIYKKIEGVNLYCFTNCGYNGCLWIDGLTVYSLHTDQPRAVLDEVAGQLIRNLQAPDHPAK